MTEPEPLYRAIRISISEWHIQAKLMSLEVGESKVYAFQLQIAVHGDVIRAVFKWLSKVITWLRLLRLVIGLKDSRQFFNKWEAKSKPIAPCTRDFPALWASYM